MRSVITTPEAEPKDSERTEQQILNGVISEYNTTWLGVWEAHKSTRTREEKRIGT